MRLLAALTAATAIGFAAPADAASPEGHFVNYDDKTGEPRGVIELVRDADGRLQGYIRGTLVPQSGPDTCEVCEGELKDQPIIGLRILRDLQVKGENPNKWRRGRVTDPDTGATYKARMTFADGFDTVELRGYVGTPALGRSQRWRRATADDVAAANGFAERYGFAPIPAPD